MEFMATMESASTSGESLLRLPQVEARTGLKKSAIYAGMKAGTFPACVKLGPRAAAWPLSAIEAWIAERIRMAQRVLR
jgi:prophage regulatory protein